MLPLILFNQPLGQRNYFDCYESAFGGLLAIHINNYILTSNLYSLLDCLALFTDKNNNIYVQTRAIDINSLLINILGLELVAVQIEELKESNKNFVISFDEFYAQENYHYQKKHFTHASLGVEIINRLSFKVIDPGLEVTTSVGYTACERIINFDNAIYDDKNNLSLFTLKSRNGSTIKYDNSEWQNSITARLRELNIALWLGKIELKTNHKNLYYGINALEKFSKSLTEFPKVETAASEFYKWIFPLFWGNDYIKRNNKTIHKEINIILEIIIKEMEIFETNLLRLKANYKVSLHNSAIKRWDNISALLRNYIHLSQRDGFPEES